MHKLILTLAIVCTAGLLLSSATADQLGSAYGGMFARGTQVVDRNDKVVANILAQGQYILEIKGNWVTFTGLLRDGLSPFPPAQIYYTSSNCSGTAYLGARTLPVSAYLVGMAGSETVSNKATLYYPAPPYQSLPISSVVVQAPTSNCEKISPQLMIDVGVAKTMPLTVAPPLSVR